MPYGAAQRGRRGVGCHPSAGSRLVLAKVGGRGRVPQLMRPLPAWIYGVVSMRTAGMTSVPSGFSRVLTLAPTKVETTERSARVEES